MTPVHTLGSELKQFRFSRLTLLVVSQGSGGLEALQSQELQKVICNALRGVSIVSKRKGRKNGR